MADRVVAMTEDGYYDYYLWDNGWIVSYNRETGGWATMRIPTPTELLEAKMNREASPDVAVSDD